MSAQLKRGVIELCVLNILKSKDSYGYDIYQEINNSLEISESTIYPILRKFVNIGICTTYLKESNEGPPRKYFKITNIGESKRIELQDNWIEFYQVVNKLIGVNKDEK